MSMSASTNQTERVCYFNGEIVPESEARVSFRDRGFKYGDAVFDTTRTFGHRIFKLDEHIDRLFKSMRYLQIDSRLTPDEFTSITKEIVEANVRLLEADDDYWVTQRVSRGVDTPELDLAVQDGPTVIVECCPLPLRARARLYRDGIDVITPSVRRTPPEAFSPRVKTNNYLNVIMGDIEARARDPEAWAVLLDTSGNLAEGQGSNIFTVTDGVIYTPKGKFVLGGISRETVIELARQIEVPVVETDLDLYDAVIADEVFLTSTSLCICGVRSVNGSAIADGAVPGPITRALTDAYIELVDYDFVAQYLKRLES